MANIMKLLRPAIVLILTFVFLIIISQSYKKLERDEIATVMSMEEKIVNMPSITGCLEYSKADIFSFKDVSRRLDYLKKQIKVVFKIRTDYHDM